MKKFFLFFVFLFFFGGLAHADSLEQARVIKMDKELYDTIVERQDGARWLLQHSRTCTSMSTEWPVQLDLNKAKTIIKILVNFNESCTVFASTPVDAEIPLTEYISSENALVPDHQIVTADLGKQYLLDYGKSCKYMREFKGKNIYLFRNGPTLQTGKSKLYLPGNRGNCRLDKVILKDGADAPAATPKEATVAMALKMPAIQSQAQNNQAYFYWDALPENQVNHVMYGYSRYKLNPSDYSVKQLPNVGRTKNHQLTIKNLANQRSYYFFFAPMDNNNQLGEWTTLSLTPVATEPVFKNEPDPKSFEITITRETDSSFTLSWPSMDNVRRYRTLFFLDGKRQWMHDFPPEETSFNLNKSKAYEGKGLRFEVSTLLKNPMDPSYSDGIYWTLPASGKKK
ncbi:hypothetical protein HZA43_01210 [Candidatus Peregrinibacteria bacterium]|nr:hypothetical protein [Candidatus Peregrinibacteria bacterium]